MPESIWAFRLKTLLLCLFVKLHLILFIQGIYDGFDLGMCIFISLFLWWLISWGSLFAISGQMSHFLVFEASPLLISSIFSLTVIALTSIAFRSGLGLKLNFWGPFLFLWAGDFPADRVMVFQTCHLWWIFVAHLYHSAKFSGALGSIIIFCCNPLGRVSLKQLMTAVEFVIPVFIKSDMKWAMCSSIFPVGPLNLISFISAHASPVWSKGLNASKKLVSNTMKVPKSRGKPCFLQLRIACPTNCSFQDATSVNSDKTNVIFLLSLLYILLLIEMKMQQSCQNLVRSSLLPENDEDILSLISQGEAVGVMEEAMSLLLGGLRFSWEKRSRSEFGLSGLGSKRKESDKGLMSPMLFFLFLH